LILFILVWCLHGTNFSSSLLQKNGNLRRAPGVSDGHKSLDFTKDELLQR
jgi:hypothetical protein